MSKRQVGIAVFILPLAGAFLSCLAGDSEDTEEFYGQCAKDMGWLDNYTRGKEILLELSRLSPEQQKNADIAAYRGEQVAFAGGSALSGPTNDLVTQRGFYLRVVTPHGRDLRPHSVMWTVLVRGKVLRVLPQNKIIVIEVLRKDWHVLDTW
jgi:hypothetical protein